MGRRPKRPSDIKTFDCQPSTLAGRTVETPDESMIEYARTLKRDGWRVFVLSNNFRERIEYYRDRFQFLEELFEECSFSCETGLVKPDVRCFKRLVERFELDPSRTFYFDDVAENVAVAQTLGLEAYIYTGIESVRAAFGHDR